MEAYNFLQIIVGENKQMARLPKPGSDSGVWGDVLNDFLKTVHNDDGSLKDGSIAENKLSTAVITKLNANAGLTRVLYNGTAYPTRPAVAPGTVEYVGPIQPTDWTNGDTWVDVS